MKNKKNIILAAVCALCVAGMIFALTFGRKTEVRFTPPPFESTASKGVPTELGDEAYGEIDAFEYKFSLCVNPEAKDGKLSLYFTNPEVNGVLLKIRVFDKAGNLLGESGLIRPGEFVKAVSLNCELSPNMEIALTVMAYEENTYHSMGNVNLTTKTAEK